MMTDINEEALRIQAARTSERHGTARVAYMHLNVTDGEGWSRAVQACGGLGKRLDICVNNAGTSYKNKASWHHAM
jgi:NADP-dependent 3-hydroxy acid dehydrogenase YdfG